MSKKPLSVVADQHDVSEIRREAEHERRAQTRRDPNLVMVRAERAHRAVVEDPATHKNPGDEYEISRQLAADRHAAGIVSFASEKDEESHHEELGRRHVDGYRSRRIATSPV